MVLALCRDFFRVFCVWIAYEIRIFQNNESDNIVTGVDIMKKFIYVSCGFITLFLGLLGIILPVLPTAPIIMLSMFCFTKGSTKIASWLRGTMLYKRYLKGYVERKGLTLKQKISIQVFASLMMLISFVLIKQWAVRGLLLLDILIHNYIFIFKIKTLEDENENKYNEEICYEEKCYKDDT